MQIIILLIMLFLHIVDDYYLQGLLAKLKQKSWWKENAPDKLYENDYIIALIEHAFSWAFMIMLPFTVKHIINGQKIISYEYLMLFILNCIIHAIVDNLKANKHKINLITDQSIHIIQIIVTWVILELLI